MRVCLLLLGCSAANSHGRLTVPRPRPPLWAEPGMQGHTSATATYRWNEPVFTLNGPMSHNGHAYRADSYRCHDFKAETPQTIITAGAPLGGTPSRRPRVVLVRDRDRVYGDCLPAQVPTAPQVAVTYTRPTTAVRANTHQRHVKSQAAGCCMCRRCATALICLV